MHFLEKPWKMWEDIVTLNLQQQKEEETVWCQSQINILQNFLWKFISHRHKKTQILVNKPVYRSINIRIKQNSDVWVLIWLCETDLRKSKTMLYGWRQLYSIHKNKRHLCRHSWRCWNYELERHPPKGKNKKVIGLMKDKLGGKNERTCCCIESKIMQLFNRQQWWR